MTASVQVRRAGIAVAAVLLAVTLLACSPGARARRVPEGLPMPRDPIDDASTPTESIPHNHALASAGGGNEDRPTGHWAPKLVTAQTFQRYAITCPGSILLHKHHGFPIHVD